MLIDEDHPLPTSTYALSKVVGETMAAHFAEWTGGTFLALRISNVHVEADYAAVPDYQSDFALRRWNLWGYVDARDVAQACRLSVSRADRGAQLHRGRGRHDHGGHQCRVAGRPVPRLALTRPVSDHETLLSIDKARAVLGYAPVHLAGPLSRRTPTRELLVAPPAADYRGAGYAPEPEVDR